MGCAESTTEVEKFKQPKQKPLNNDGVVKL